MIRLEKIDKYFGGQRVLSSVDLQLAPGNVTALIGPSGSGKSTLLRCVNLLEIPESGSLEVGEQRLEFSRDQPPSREAVLTVPEVFQAAQRIASVTYEPLILYTEAALVYLVFSSVLSSAQVRLERKFGRHALFQAGN